MITAIVILFVGKTLYKNGRPFLINVFHGNISLADSINKLLLVGYYLVNIGYTVIALRIWQQIDSTQNLVGILSYKIGLIVFILGIMHVFNVISLVIVERFVKIKPSTSNH